MIYLTLFFEFFKVGLFTFGGGYAMIPLIEELVLRHGWIGREEFFDFLGVCESTPGPIAINMATYLGSTQAGLLGAVVATLGVVLPSFAIILLVASVLKNFEKNRGVLAFLSGVKPVVVALIGFTGLRLLLQTVGVSVEAIDVDVWRILLFAILVLIYFGYSALFGKKMSAVALILCSAGLGILLCSVLAAAGVTPI